MRITFSAAVLAGLVLFGYGIYRALSRWDLQQLETTGLGVCVVLISLFCGALTIPFEQDAERDWKEYYAERDR